MKRPVIDTELAAEGERLAAAIGAGRPEYRVLTLPRGDDHATRELNYMALHGWRVAGVGSDRDGVLTVILAAAKSVAEAP